MSIQLDRELVWLWKLELKIYTDNVLPSAFRFFLKFL